jgi:hypothetical protein
MLHRLKIEFAKNAVALSGKVSTMSDQQLIATWIAYDPETASASAYKGVVKSLLDELHMIDDLGVHEIFSDDTQDQNHLLVKVTGLGYAVVNQDVETFLYDAGPYEFLGVVHDHFLEDAKGRAKKVGRRPRGLTAGPNRYPSGHGTSRLAGHDQLRAGQRPGEGPHRRP